MGGYSIDLFFTVGFGFDCQTRQFKVLRLIYTVGGYHYERLIRREVEVFVLGTNRWRRVNTDVPFRVWGYSPQAFLYGAVHWIGHRSDKSMVIVVFDVHEEVFREIEVPSGIAHLGEDDLSLTVYRDSLCLLVQECCSCLIEPLSSVLSIWVMRQYGVKESWTKQFSVDMLEPRGFTKLVGFRKCGKMLVVKGDRDLVSYDPEMTMSMWVEELELVNGVVNEYFEAIPLVESLVLLKEDQQGQKDEPALAESACEDLPVKRIGSSKTTDSL